MTDGIAAIYTFAAMPLLTASRIRQGADALTIEKGPPMKKTTSKRLRTKPPDRVKRAESFAAGVERGMQMAARSARKIARMYGTPIYILERGKIVAKKP